MIENYVQLNVVISGAITRGRWPQVSDQIYIVERCVKKGKVLVNYSLHLVRFPLKWKTTKSWKRTLPALMCCPRLKLSNERYSSDHAHWTTVWFDKTKYCTICPWTWMMFWYEWLSLETESLQANDTTVHIEQLTLVPIYLPNWLV